jgi:hypothetical protein
MTLDELKAETNRILAESLLIPPRRRLKWVKMEIRKLPSEHYNFVFQWISTTETFVGDELNMKATTKQLIVSASCLAICGILAFCFSHPTGIQYLFIRGLFALGVVGLAVGLLIGTVNLKWNLAGSLVVTATGGFALLILMYYVNPPSPPNPEVKQSQQLQGTNSTASP